MKTYIFSSQFSVTANSKEEAFQDLMKAIDGNTAVEVSHFGTEFIEEQD